MNKWYKSAFVKGFLIFFSVLSAVVALLSFVIVSTYSVNIREIWNRKPIEYTDSKEFENLMCRATMEVLNRILYEDLFETDGKYNPDKWIDIMQYGYNEKKYEEEQGVRYKLSDLETWSEEYQNHQYIDETAPVVVCQKEDKTYYYYYWEEFLNLLREKKLVIDMEGYTAEEISEALYSGNMSINQISGHLILGPDDKIMYRDFWGFNGVLEEEMQPEGGNNILDVVNHTPELNRKLSDVYTQLRSVLSSLYYDLKSYESSGEWTEGNTNFAYIYVDKETRQVYTNRKEYQDYSSVKENISDIQNNAKYLIVQSKLSDFKTNMDITANDWKEFVKAQRGNNNSDFIFAAAVDSTFAIQDSFYLDKKMYDEYAPYINSGALFLIFSILVMIVCLIWLTIITGRNRKDDEIHLNVFDRWKTELAAVFVIGIWMVPVMFWSVNGNMALGYFAEKADLMTATIGYSYEYASGYIPTVEDIIVLTGTAAYTMILFLIGYLSLVRRIKAGTMWKNSMLYALCRFCQIFWNHRSVSWKMIVSGLFLIGIHWMLALFRNPALVVITLVADGFILYYLVMSAIARNELTKGVKAVAGGDLEYQISMKYLRGEHKEMAEMLNDIGSGLQKAVEKSVKSERLKTDLITNVSHDIKTPLTSIINYVDILKRSNIEDPKIQGYLEILETKAQRLKTLTEDVVEASKVSSGNINLEMMDVNLVEMINQTAGEFAEKFSLKNLELIQTLPNEPAIIHVDGRRMWRVLENLYNNAAKYAMPGTRIYADLHFDKDDVVFSLKNVSEYPLNFSADELTERFIRGDISRSTEGSGLGLSIAKSLVQMQGGTLELYLDGDLFKVTVCFGRSGKKENDPCFFRGE